MSAARMCPALLVSAPASGQGKTTVTAALAWYWRSRGLRVRVFKTGPDFLDPMVHALASGAPCYQLDLWMGDEAHVRELLWQAAGQADVILVEGVMGLHDGTASSAALAERLGLPVLAVIDASAMAQTFGAIALGLASYRPGLPFAGVLANRVGSAGHAQMLQESLPAGLRWYGALPRDDTSALPSRHLGLVQADEVADLDTRLQQLAQALAALDLPLPAPVRFEAPAPLGPVAAKLTGVTVAVARDAAFSFLYSANLDLLRTLGAELCFFSPLANEPVPAQAQAVYLPGGYPELHLHTLSLAHRTRDSLRAHHAAGRPLVAECGGLLALADTLTDQQGDSAPMWGLLPGQGRMQPRLVNLGLHSAALPEGLLRGHTFHHGRLDSPAVAHGMSQAQRHHGTPEAVYRLGPGGRLHASFLHLYFPSNPEATGRLFAPALV
jgi:cobyrinic acid a,c-diamide synthase